MSSPIFFSKLIRTKENLTCGITVIPLTKSSKIFFNCDNENNYYECLWLMNNFNLPVETKYNRTTDRYFIQTLIEVDSATIKQIWRNFKSFRPKFNSNWRYLMWELDNQEQIEFDKVINVYNILKLPVFVHKTMRGWHFISIKPIEKALFNWATDKLRETNDNYPPITLRIKPNKYVGEDKIFYDGYIISDKFHTDTKQLRDLIINQNFVRLAELYQIVWYAIDKMERKE